MSGRRQIDIDKERATVLLLINTHLIKKAYQLYVSFLSNPPALQQLGPQGRQQVSDQYQNLNRRLQCNLSVLSYINDVYHNKAAAQQPNRLHFPVILSAPAELPELRSLYKRLQDLYPEALQFLKAKLQHMKQQQEMQRPGMAQPQQPMPQSQRPMAHPQQQQQQQQQQQPRPLQHHTSFEHFGMPQGGDMNIPQRGTPNQAQKPHPQQKPMDMTQPSSFGGPPKEPDFLPYNNNNPNGNSGFNGGFAGGEGHDGSMPINMSSISPQQILQQQNGGNPGNDFVMDFY